MEKKSLFFYALIACGVFAVGRALYQVNPHFLFYAIGFIPLTFLIYFLMQAFPKFQTPKPVDRPHNACRCESGCHSMVVMAKTWAPPVEIRQRVSGDTFLLARLLQGCTTYNLVCKDCGHFIRIESLGREDRGVHEIVFREVKKP